MNAELSELLKAKGATIVKFVDLGELPAKMRRRFNRAVLIGLTLSPEYIYRISKENTVDYSEFNNKETAAYIIAQGYEAYPQSEDKNNADHFYDDAKKTSSLPHKTIALLAGIGWIGKNDLLVTKEYGSALCMSTVLTDAPFITENRKIMEQHCGNCEVCRDICPSKVIYGKPWRYITERAELVDVFHCSCCLKCLAYCP